MNWLQKTAVKMGVGMINRAAPITVTKDWGDIQLHFHHLKGGSRRKKLLSAGEVADYYRSWAYFCINAISSRISALEWAVTRDDAQRPLSPAEDGKAASAILKPWAIPNQSFTHAALFYYLSSQLLMYGQSFLYKARDRRGVVVEYWPLDAGAFNGLIMGKTEGEGIRAFAFRGLPTIPAGDIIFFRKVNPEPGKKYVGKSPLESVAMTLDHDFYLERYLTRFFEQDARPSFVIQYRQRMNQDVIDRLLESWEEKFKGNPWLPGVLDSGADIKQLSTDLRGVRSPDMEEKIRDKVLAAFNVPKTALGNVEDVNRASAMAMDPVFNSNAVMPVGTIFSDGITQDIVREWDPNNRIGLRFCFPNVVPRDKEFELKQFKEVKEFLTPQEGRRHIQHMIPGLKLDELQGDGINVLYINPLRSQPIAQAVDTGTDTAPDPLPSTPHPVADPVPSSGDRLPVAQYTTNGVLVKGVMRTEAEHEEAALPLWYARGDTYWGGQRDRVLQRLRSQYPIRPQLMLDSHMEAKKWYDEFLPLSVRSLLFGAVASLDRLNLLKGWDQAVRGANGSPGAVDVSKLQLVGKDEADWRSVSVDDLLRDPNFTANLQTNLGLTSSELMRSRSAELFATLSEGMELGEPLSRLVERVENVYGDLLGGRWKAERIARTEIHGALSLGNYNALKYGRSVGALRYHQWLATPDGRTRLTHARAHGQIVEVGRPFG
jgi:hypothetical protein